MIAMIHIHIYKMHISYAYIYICMYHTIARSIIHMKLYAYHMYICAISSSTARIDVIHSHMHSIPFWTFMAFRIAFASCELFVSEKDQP
jgi:hypothetical protein